MQPNAPENTNDRGRKAFENTNLGNLFAHWGLEMASQLNDLQKIGSGIRGLEAGTLRIHSAKVQEKQACREFSAQFKTVTGQLETISSEQGFVEEKLAILEKKLEEKLDSVEWQDRYRGISEPRAPKVAKDLIVKVRYCRSKI